VVIDDQYADWYLARHGVAVPRDMVLPDQHALQGHPESGALWEKFVNSVIARHGFHSTTHERSLYQGVYKGHRMLICRQVDDLAIGSLDMNAVKDLVHVICAEDGIDLRDEGVLDSFNGVDVEQRDRYIKITCETYIDKLLAHYGWSSSGSRETDEKPINLSPLRRHNRCSTITLPHHMPELSNIVISKQLPGFRTEVSWVR
jgi:hypothetical protein